MYSTNHTPTGFSVREQQGGASSLSFSYRIVGKRKDIEGKRLAKVHLPPEPTRESIAAAPEPPTVPITPPAPVPVVTPLPAAQPASNPLPQPRP